MIGLCILGFYCFFGSIFGSDFAKLHFFIPFLNFPIFIGEIVILLCLSVSGWRIYTQKIHLTKLQCLFFGYLGLIVLWAGYECLRVNGSPLALRNAVLFFYPIFAFFGYSFYNPSFFSKKIIQVPLAVLLFSLSFVSQIPFFYFVYFILFFVILYAGSPESWRCRLVVVALFVDYSFFTFQKSPPVGHRQTKYSPKGNGIIRQLKN